MDVADFLGLVEGGIENDNQTKYSEFQVFF